MKKEVLYFRARTWQLAARRKRRTVGGAHRFSGGIARETNKGIKDEPSASKSYDCDTCSRDTCSGNY